MSPTWGIETIASLILIHLHPNKISEKQHLRTVFLLKDQHSKKTKPHQLSLKNLTSKQYQKIKSSVVDSNTRLNSLFPFFDNFHGELSAGFCLVDNFSNHFSFHTVNHKEKKIRNAHVQNLNKVFENFFSDSNIVVIITDVSIKKICTTSISYVYFSGNIIAKTIY